MFGVSAAQLKCTAASPPRSILTAVISETSATAHGLLVTRRIVAKKQHCAASPQTIPCAKPALAFARAPSHPARRAGEEQRMATTADERDASHSLGYEWTVVLPCAVQSISGNRREPK